MKKINLIGYLGFKNFGDDLMLYGLLSELNKRNIAYKINIFMKENTLPIDYKIIWCNLDIHVIKLNKLTNLLLPFYIILNDEVAWCGGTCIYEDPNDIKLEGMNWIKRISNYCRIFRKEFTLINIGVNNLRHNNSKRIAKLILNNASKISVRDRESLHNIKRYTCKHVVLGGDLASLNNIIKKINIPNRDYIIFCGHYQYYNNKDIIFFYKNELEKIYKKTNKKIVFIPFHLGKINDNIFHEQIISLINLEKENYEILSKYTFDDLQDLFSNSYLVISMRLHALFFAELLGVPNIGINYNDKVKFFIEKSKYLTSYRIKEIQEEIYIDDIKTIIQNTNNEEFIINEKNYAKKGVLI